ncbi:MAG: hypothetical protein WD512_15310, partial [Candidatus Paceibacterota bacterium]
MSYYCIKDTCKGAKNGKKKRANFNFKGMKTAFCAECKEEGMINVSGNKTCAYIYPETKEQCQTQPTFNIEGEKPKYCSVHMDKKTMINTLDRNCITCKKKKAEYNFEGKVKMYCGACKSDDMVSLKAHRCITCKKKALYHNGIDKTKRYCIDHRGDVFVCESANYCITGCGIRASFGPKDSQPKYCATHKHLELNMINLTHPLCKHEGCKEMAHYNFTGEKGEKFCSEHKDTGMIFLYRKMCTKCNKKYPSFNWEGEVTPIYCGECAQEGMINVSRPDCHFKGCNIQPSFNFEGFTRPIYCVTHKETNMICVVRSPCQHDGCPSRYPSYNYPGETKGLYCITHKKDDMVNVKKEECLGGCGVTPSFNYPGERPKYCKICKSDDMIEVIHDKCKHKNCNGRKIALFNFPDKKDKLYCIQHKEEGMINLRTKRCAHPKCSDGKTATTAL